MADPRLIDNKRVSLAEVLKEHTSSAGFKHLSIATGYWDLAGMIDIIDDLESFESVRILIGQEPIPDRLQEKFNLLEDETLFPDDNFAHDLEAISESDEKIELLRKTAIVLRKLIENKTIQVKVFRKPRLHAKAYIFGDFTSNNAIGIIGSSNFTAAGLSNNAELDYVEYDYQKVLFEPKNELQENGHLSWFNELWDDEEAIEWSGEFGKIVEDSRVGDMTFGPYDVYIKTLMEVFADEMEPPLELEGDWSEKLMPFQNRNAGILIKKLERQGVAMLSDSVGLGKTITAGAVMRHYLDSNARIRVIVPAGLMNQWEDDLEKVLGIERHRDYQLISMQNSNRIHELCEQDERFFRRNKHVDLFVIDEAHNLRSSNSTRRDAILDMLVLHKDAKVLLLTATPVNNRLIDFSNQIQLGLKDSCNSVDVPVIDSNGSYHQMDFIDALRQIESDRRRQGTKFDWQKYKPSIDAGLRHYLVRSTRAGIQKEFPYLVAFPETEVDEIFYEYSKQQVSFVFGDIIVNDIKTSVIENLTQLSKHPLDAYLDDDYIKSMQDDKKAIIATDNDEEQGDSVIVNIFKAICCLGLVPYRPNIYKHDYYGKGIKDIDEQVRTKKDKQTKSQLAIHNLIHISWLKRIESSTYALLESLKNYRTRLDSFEQFLRQGYIVSLSDISQIESQYGDDIDAAFSDYEIDDDGNPVGGVEKIPADEAVFNIEQMKLDIQRDKDICDLIEDQLNSLVEDNPKLEEFKKRIIEPAQKSGDKVLVFSFFADTIKYLEKKLGSELCNAAFISGQTSDNTHKVELFSPKSKNYELKDGEEEIQFLFATDVLSEGQNLQDAGILVNYDLHWNPVRMIQRNGRINRLGSEHEKVFIYNCKPAKELDAYLRLVKRLEYKIENINQTIGLDQDVLTQGEANPMEFVEKAQRASDVDSVLNNDLNWTDDFIAELRAFVKDNDEQEVKRVSKIPIGKWNYLPKTSSSKNALAMHSVTFDDSESSGDIMFFEAEKMDRNQKSRAGSFVAELPVSVKFIETGDALNRIKTVLSDNERQRDSIKIDKQKIAEGVQNSAAVKLKNNDNQKNIFKDSDNNAIDTLSEYRGSEIRQVLEKKFSTNREQQEFRNIVRAVNSDVRQGSLTLKTLNAFDQFYNKRKEAIENNVAPLVKEQKTLLFYYPDDED